MDKNKVPCSYGPWCIRVIQELADEVLALQYSDLCTLHWSSTWYWAILN